MARPRVAMPQDVADALQMSGLCDAYGTRPPYQRNDWLIWIGGAKRPETRARRLAAMLAELRAGHGYMGMPWHPRGTRKQD